jgi:hypothetical protein
VHIAWSSLAQVLVVGLLAGAGLVVAFTIGVLGLSRAASAREADGRTDPVGYGMAALAFLVVAAAVLYGIYLIVPQFH